MFLVKSASKGSTTVAFPDVCKTPAPPAPFVPVPYPNVQYQENLKTANKVDAMTKTGNKQAKKTQNQAIDNLFSQTGIKAKSATQAVIVGKTAHGKQPITSSQQLSRSQQSTSNITKSHHDILSSIINNIRA